MRRFHFLPACSLALSLFAASPGAQAQSAETDSSWPAFLRESPSGDYWRLIASPYTVHYHKDDDGNHENVYMIGIERQRADRWMWGGVYFSNSFGQPSAYVYLGQQYSGFVSRWPELFAQWSVGVLYGYKPPYEDKVPYNYNGFSPGATISLGWQFTRQFSVQMDALGSAGMMFQASWNFR
jgi:hypothetical protein